MFFLCNSLGSELGFDAELLLKTSHGRRTIDTLKVLAPGKANWECQLFPSMAVTTT
jgi:hypothetical protein